MIRRIAECLLLVSFFLLTACAKELTSDELIAQARESMAAGEYGAANVALKNAALQAPENLDIRVELAAVALALGDGATAEKEARRAVELGAPPEKVTLALVNAIYLQGDNDRVLAESEQIPAEVQPAVAADVLAYRALALIQQQKFKLAESVIDEALKKNENSALAVLAQAHYEAQVDRREKAMTLAKRSAEIDPELADAWTLIGDLHMADGNLEAAGEAFDTSIDKRNYVSLSNARRALVLAQLEQYGAARGDIRDLYAGGYKAHHYVNFVKGYIDFREKKYPEATVALEKSVAADPGNPVAALYLAASYMEEGRLEQARIIANQLYAQIPNSVEIARLFASLSVRQQDLGAARETLVALLEVEQDDEVALGMLGSMALMEGKGDEAVDYFQRLAATSPDDSSIQSMLKLARTMRGDFVEEVSAAAEQSVSAEDVDDALLSAGIALREGQLKEAVTIAENLQQQYPDRVGPLNMLAAIHLSVGDWRKGKLYLEQVLLIEPMEPSAVKSLAKIQMRTGEESRALELISAFLKEYPEDKEANGILSELVVATESYEQAETRLIELLEKDPANLEVKARLMKLYFDNGKFEQVSVQTENLTNEDIQSQPSLMELRGKALYNLGNTEGAASVWERWAKLAPDSVLANFYYGDSLAKSNQLARALESLEISRKLNAGYLPARIAIIRLSAETGDTDKALAEMEQLQSELTEERADVWYTRGWLNAKLGKYSEAEQALQKSLSLQPTPDSVMLLFATQNSLGDADAALASLEGWLEKFPEHMGLLAVLGQAYLARGNEEKAVGIYKRMLSLDTKSVLALNNLAWLLRKTDSNQALQYAERASALAPEDPYVMSTLATLLAGSGKAAEGEQTLRKAVTLHPDNMQLKLDLGRLLVELDKSAAARPYLEEVEENGKIESLVAQAKALLQATE
jgi:putative PEP-CTERM system TPR-repeat lipoprotein